MISSIEDDDIRKSYATRAKNKYDSLKDETVKWKDVVKAYEEQQKESNAELTREKKKRRQRMQEINSFAKPGLRLLIQD